MLHGFVWNRKFFFIKNVTTNGPNNEVRRQNQLQNTAMTSETII